MCVSLMCSLTEDGIFPFLMHLICRENVKIFSISPVELIRLKLANFISIFSFSLDISRFRFRLNVAYCPAVQAFSNTSNQSYHLLNDENKYRVEYISPALIKSLSRKSPNQ